MNNDPSTKDSRREQNLGTVIAWNMKEEEENITTQQSHNNHTSQCEDPESGSVVPDVQASPMHQKQLQPGTDTSNRYINLNKCIIPAHMLS